MNITPYLFVPLIAWLAAQGIKVIIEILKGDADIRYLYASGGMPSSHSAVVCALMVYAGLNSGVDTALFGVTAVIAGIVMYDSFGVRRSAGEQAKALNKLIKQLSHDGNLRKPDEFNRLREILGHQPLEVIVGALLGSFIAVLFNLDKLQGSLSYLGGLFTSFELNFVYAKGAALVVLPLAIWFFCRKWLKKRPQLRELNKYFVGGNVILGLGLLMAGFISREQIVPYGQRWVAASIAMIWLIFMLILAWRYLNIRRVARFSAETGNTRRDDWLKKAGKKS